MAHCLAEKPAPKPAVQKPAPGPQKPAPGGKLFWLYQYLVN